MFTLTGESELSPAKKEGEEVQKNIVGLTALALLALLLMTTSPASAAVGGVQVIVVNSTPDLVVEVHLSQGCYNFGDGTQKDVPPGQTMNVEGNSNQTFNVTLYDQRPNQGEIFVGCIAAHSSVIGGPFTLTVTENGQGEPVFYHNRADGWMPPLWAPRFDPEFKALVVKSTPQMTQAQFNTMLSRAPQSIYTAKVLAVPNSTFRRKAEQSGITTTVSLK